MLYKLYYVLQILSYILLLCKLKIMENQRNLHNFSIKNIFKKGKETPTDQKSDLWSRLHATENIYSFESTEENSKSN